MNYRKSSPSRFVIRHSDLIRISDFWFRIFLGCLLISTTSASSRAADSDIPPQVDRFVADGLAFLARQQHPDGSFDAGGPRVAMTGLALMSFLAAGNTPDEGKYGLAVRGAMNFLIRSAPDDGYFGKVDGSRMYGQGIATLALAEACGADHDPHQRRKARAVVERAVALIFTAQDVPKVDVFAGGWRYEPGSPDSDLSLSGWNALALRAASNIGIDVPKDRVTRALGYVQRCFRPEQNGFAYQPGQQPNIAMTGVGMLNLYLLEGPDRPELARAATYLVAHPVDANTRFPYYATYYSTQAAFQAGGATWKTVWQSTWDGLRDVRVHSRDDGGWLPSTSGEEPGRVYATSMALLTLTVPYRLLPVYQR